MGTEDQAQNKPLPITLFSQKPLIVLREDGITNKPDGDVISETCPNPKSFSNVSVVNMEEESNESASPMQENSQSLNTDSKSTKLYLDSAIKTCSDAIAIKIYEMR